MNATEDVNERINLLGRDRVGKALSKWHGLPGVSGVLMSLEGCRPSSLQELPTRFEPSYWFAKPPTGTPWPSRYVHHTFETCWLGQHDRSIGDKLHLQTAMLPRHAQSLMLWQMCGIQWWINHNGVTIFPEDHLVEACSKTDVLDCVAGSDIHASFPHMMFGLSDRAKITNEKGDDWINYILVTFVENGKEEAIAVGAGTFNIRMPGDCPRYVVINSFWKSGFVSSFSIPLKEQVTLKDIIAQFSKEFIDDEFRTLTLTPDQLKEEHDETAEIGRQITAMVFNLCLMMQSYPEYVTKQPEKNNRRLCMRKQPPPGTFRINDRVAPLKPPQVQEGTKTTEDTTGEKQRREPHWRRGHWRRQPHTSEWEVLHPEVKVVLFSDGRHAHMVWIRPVFVS